MVAILFLLIILLVVILFLLLIFIGINFPYPLESLEGLDAETLVNVSEEQLLVLWGVLYKLNNIMGKVEDVLVIGKDPGLEILHELFFVDFTLLGLVSDIWLFLVVGWVEDN